MKKFAGICFFMYCAFLFYIFFLARRRPSPSLVRREDRPQEALNLVPLRAKIDYFRGIGAVSQQTRMNFYSDFLGNIFIFIPIGFFLPLFLKSRNPLQIIAIAAGVSIAVETIQYVFSVGIADIDDVILNTTGAAIGYILSVIYKKIEPISAQ